MLAQENNPPDLWELTKQRTRWDSGRLEMRRGYNWLMSSRHIKDTTRFLAVFNGLINSKAALPGDFICYHIFSTILAIYQCIIIIRLVNSDGM